MNFFFWEVNFWVILRKTKKQKQLVQTPLFTHSNTKKPHQPFTNKGIHPATPNSSSFNTQISQNQKPWVVRLSYRSKNHHIQAQPGGDPVGQSGKKWPEPPLRGAQFKLTPFFPILSSLTQNPQIPKFKPTLKSPSFEFHFLPLD